MSGFIKLHRGWRDCEAFKNEPCTQREAWIWLLEHTAWKDCQRRDAQGALIEVKRGQFHTSIRTLASEWQWSRGRVERFLNDLKTSHMVSHETGHGGLMITVCNYDKYQANEPSAGPSAEPSEEPSAGQAQGHTRRSNKNIKENKKGVLASRPDGVSEALWDRFVQMRKAKKAPVTQRALDGLRREADKAQWPLADVLSYCVAKDWRGFEAGWVRGQLRPGGIGI